MVFSYAKFVIKFNQEVSPGRIQKIHGKKKPIFRLGRVTMENSLEELKIRTQVLVFQWWLSVVII
jgi:hypothetical protein